MSLSRLITNISKQKKPFKLMPGGIHKDIHLPHTEEVELYHNVASSASQKVRLALAQKNISYKSHHIEMAPNHSDPSCIHNNSAEYSLINPGRIVPTLVHLGNPVYESHDIIDYIDANLPGNGYDLMPPECDQNAMNEWMECGAMHGNMLSEENQKLRAGNCVPGVTLPFLIHRFERCTFFEILEQVILGKRKMIPLIANLFPSQIRSSKKFKNTNSNGVYCMKKHLNALNEFLSLNELWMEDGKKYIAGSKFSKADIPWIVIIERCLMVNLLKDDFLIDGDEMTALKLYWRQIEEEECYKTAIAQQTGYAKIKEMAQNMKVYRWAKEKGAK